MSTAYEMVGRTAFVIANWRAEETEAASPLFSDHVANAFLNAEATEASNAIASASPSTRYLVRYRTRYFDQTFLDKIAAGVRQFLILGSGLDTRPIRLAADGVRYFEVEQGHVLEFKRKQLEQHGYAQAATFVPAEYTSVDFLSALEAQGFDFDAQTFILWEGNVFYLEYQSAVNTLIALRDRLKRFEITFDYLSKKLITKATGYRKSEALLDGFRSLGAPWNTGFDDITELARTVGLDVAGNFLIADYANDAGLEMKVDRTLFDDYSIATFANAAGRLDVVGGGRS
ncbi:class I SAM-dependent methyltransferase [Corallococcus exiguus]|uniref:class I SAM-dependent methyltransferase n=1 Tax=Corallococcus TaxID=83461 RepID=UPI000EC7F688|nr:MULTISPECIES: SAM-dependent methyltransferase [Corallococcus]NRD52538.1 class I SAM-dependent methyltransferase [Corallococcus exiguus]NRD61449.1 class I SAM-dependent methyltransferase [Corallococcus exiguus]RKI20288.1 SAM-dependent methyltransferase [Corallococcus sp. AB030]RUO95231.1 SAM-dependent methyltransferase [Corallococcus sp. AB018]